MTSKQPEGYIKGPKDSNGEVYLHRQVYRSKHPEVEAECELCYRPVFFDEEKTSPYSAVIDHRDHDRSNNDIENLRALCPRCNLRARPGVETYPGIWASLGIGWMENEDD